MSFSHLGLAPFFFKSLVELFRAESDSIRSDPSDTKSKRCFGYCEDWLG